MYWPSVTPSPENRCVSSFCFNMDKMLISSCGIILIVFPRSLYRVVQSYGMVGVGVLSLTIFGYGAVILRATFGGAGVSTLGGASPLKFVLVMYVPPLEVTQVCPGRLETGLQVVLGISTGFHQCVQMVPHD